ncbi:glycoside hydrolase family 5 protein [Zopfia rhizophila CBS 207.26]|uniref:Glycoside hydrolase family 5 protein n=1 Tax=Zopfia rhizophila CBS 207.26 TaxID=1314779 RepID=A0A6A6DR20_9PEZI|nr:glycoside hydrolase family 5 protein [Zopfia rhizophila CBS 207.26]
MPSVTETITAKAASSYLSLQNGDVNPPCSMLRVSGTKIVNTAGQQVVLKGAGLGGMLNMENFITGYSGHEFEHRAALAEVLGQEQADFFFDRLIHHFFTEADAALFASLGFNCLRVPFNYRHFMDDDNPDVIKQSGFELLDRIVNICAKYNIYVVLDLHAVPGGQNQDWHSDSGLNRALFWEFRDFQDRAIQLWEALASHYASNPVIAGYNPLNEPADPKHTRLLAWYDRAENAIRAKDPDHMLFLDGNTYAMDFRAFPVDKTLPNTVYSCHDYSMMGFPLPEQYEGTEEQKTKLRASFKRKVDYMQKAGVPIRNGEWGPVYQDPRTDTNAAATNEKRFSLLKEQLQIYREFGDVSWSIWLYKDIGYQGMVYVNPDSPYMKLIRPFVEKKQRLGLDFWGVVDKSEIDNVVYKPFIEKLKESIPSHLLKRKYPKIWTFDRQVERVVREILMSEYHAWEMAELFAGKTKEELEELAASFALENCVTRDQLNKILTEDAEISRAKTQ